MMRSVVLMILVFNCTNCSLGVTSSFQNQFGHSEVNIDNATVCELSLFLLFEQMWTSDLRGRERERERERERGERKPSE